MSQLNDIVGVNVKELDIDLFFKGDILEYEGPILSHYIDQKQINYLMLTLGYDDERNQSIWLLIKVGVTELLDFFKKKITLLRLIQNEKEMGVLVWSDHKGNHVKYRMINMDKLPSIYFPSDKSYFNEEISTSYSIVLRNKLNKSVKEKQKLKILNKFQKVEMAQDNLVYHTIYNDVNVLRVRLLSSLLEPTIKDKGQHVSALDMNELNRVSEIVAFASKMEQDPFGNVYDELIASTEKMFKLPSSKISREKKYDAVVFEVTKVMGQSITHRNAIKQNRLYAYAYMNFLEFLDDSSMEIAYFDISENVKYKKILEKK
ncbi:MAG: hypothetical protein RL308_109 [Bacteroidota bacterium]|jgi:hypothetical protein